MEDKEKINELKNFLQKNANLGCYYKLNNCDITMLEVVDYINKLESENEQLKSTIKSGYFIISSRCNGKTDYIELLKDMYAKGRKETAEKFYDKVMSFIGSNQKFWIVDDEHITIIEVDKLFDFVMETAKQLGVKIKE